LLPTALTMIVVTGTAWAATHSLVLVGVLNVVAAFIVVSIIATSLVMRRKPEPHVESEIPSFMR
ncbi:NADH-quinone oxidoreductase subunit H, partial [Candidatus Poribacteria bacterium]|nr:NADH-quinone oxidoreductase subunit H [Candidatus Poribacteria bacterium]